MLLYAQGGSQGCLTCALSANFGEGLSAPVYARCRVQGRHRALAVPLPTASTAKSIFFYLAVWHCHVNPAVKELAVANCLDLGPPNAGKILPAIFENFRFSTPSDIVSKTISNLSENVPKPLLDTSQDIQKLTKK